MLLDGLSFVAETRYALQDSPAANLLSNPLALALESMRGRPSLHLLGTEQLEDVWLDAKSNIGVCVLVEPGELATHIGCVGTYTRIRR